MADRDTDAADPRASDSRTSDSRRHWLNRAKHVSPRQRISLVGRPHLLDRLDAALDLRLCLITAPAGFGKTTLLAQWRDRLVERQIRVAWLSLDEEDGEIRRFLSYVIFALAAAGLETGDLPTLAEQGLMEMPINACISQILSHIGDSDERVVLVFDDYHRVQSRAVDGLVNRLLEGSPDNFSIVVNSRIRPALIVPQLLAAGEAVEIDADALRLSLDESRLLLDPEVTDEDLKFICERTEGWAIAVQLAKLLVGRTGQSLQEQFRGTGEHLASYLTDQVLAELSPELQDFMVQTSVLDRFNAKLANAVTDRRDSWAMLQRLRPLQSLLIPLDDRQEWFRYHHLVAECLQNLLWYRQPELVRPLHLRASAWMDEAGDVIEAVRYASLASDFDRCASLIEAAGGWELILFGGIGHLRELLRFLPDNELHRFPRVVLAKAYLAIKDGNLLTARAMFQQVEAMPEATLAARDRSQGLGRDMLNIGVLLDAYEAKPVQRADLMALLAQRDQVSPGDHLTHAVIECSGVIDSLVIGDLETAERLALDAGRSMRQARSPLGLNYTYLHGGLAALYPARLGDAEASFSEALRQAQDNVGKDSGLSALAQVLMGAVHFLSDKWTEEAQTRFHRAREHVEQYDGWFEVYAISLETAVADALRHDDYERAGAIVATTRALAEARDIERLVDQTDAYRLGLLLRQGQTVQAQHLAHLLEMKYPLGCWQERRYLWRPYIEIGLALAHWHRDHDRMRALKHADDVAACCAEVGAHLFSIKAHLMRATLLEQASRRREALDALLDAATVATPERILMPFLIIPGLTPLLHAAHKKLRTESGDPAVLNFIAAALERGAHSGSRHLSTETGLSPRERQVVVELVRGHSNKAIARRLDLTEHTVKFHLRNIFTKLKVERRADAIAVLRRLEPGEAPLPVVEEVPTL
jgi:LuxR family transcriptional regulator, maltose regulon positive regulatory protein